MGARALVVVSYGSSDLLERNLAAWDDAASAGWIVVVVDNPTTPAERRRVQDLAEAHDWLLVTPSHNLGFGDGCDAAVRAAQEAAHARPGGALASVVLLNPDARLTRAAADELAARVEAAPDLMLAPRMLRSDGRPSFTSSRLDPRTGRGTAPEGSGVPWLTGACLAMSAEAWDTLDGFASAYFLYWEDIDLAWRWYHHGGRALVADDLTCVHDPGGTQDAGAASAKSPLYYYYNCRNRLVFAGRHLGGRARMRWGAHAPAYAVEVVLRGGRRQLVRPWRNALPAARGTLSGLGALLRGPRPHDIETLGEDTRWT